MNYDKQFLLAAIDSVIETAEPKLNQHELQLLQSIRKHIDNVDNEDSIEIHFMDLVKWFLLIMEYLNNIK